MTAPTLAAARGLGRKQNLADPAAWLAARTRAADQWPPAALDHLVDQTLTEIRDTARGRRAAYGWSGGKDSIALGWLCEQADITDCVLAISNLEFPAFLTWVTDHMPDGLTVINTGPDLAWLLRPPAGWSASEPGRGGRPPAPRTARLRSAARAE